MEQDPNPSRRELIQMGIGGLTIASVSSAALPSDSTASAENSKSMKVRYAELLPREFRKRLKEMPIAYLPLGTLEWHGEHLPLGSDAIQSEELMMECARQFGGMVMPPIHLGPDRAKPIENGSMLIGMDYAESTTPPRALDGSCYWIPLGLHLQIVDAILIQLKRVGFRAVFADGHGPSRNSWVENLQERETRLGLKLFGVTREINKQWKSQMDHAARNETSLMMHYRPDGVDLSQLSSDRTIWPQGVAGEDPRDATAAYGKECMMKSVELVRQMFVQAGLL